MKIRKLMYRAKGAAFQSRLSRMTVLGRWNMLTDLLARSKGTSRFNRVWRQNRLNGVSFKVIAESASKAAQSLAFSSCGHNE